MNSPAFFHDAVQIICTRILKDPIPFSERLYQAAGAAVGFGLQLADLSPSKMDQLTDSEQLDRGLTAVVDSFAEVPIQKELHFAARTMNTPLLALAAGLMLQYFLRAHPDTSCQEWPGLLEMATAYCLSFTLTLARRHPSLARSYRQLIPPNPVGPTPP